MKPKLRSKDLTQLRALERVVTDLEDMADRQRKERQKLLQIRLYDEIYDAYQLYREPRRQERVASPLVLIETPLPADASVEQRVVQRVKDA